MNRAFILARPGDFWLAEKCCDRLNTQGWVASIVIDEKEWKTPIPDGVIHHAYSPGIKGMNGNAVALAILNAIANNSENGDRVMKLDCDIWLDEPTAEWLKQTGSAKGFMLHRPNRRSLAWGGIWSADAEHLAMAIDYPHEKCSCPESVLNVRALHKTGIYETHPTTFVKEWLPDEEKIGICTLTISKSIPRRIHGTALFEPPCN